MAKRRLTEQGIERLRPPKTGRLEVPDSQVPGLVFRVTDKGAKSWSLLYRIQGEGGETDNGLPKRGKLRRMTLGRYPVLDLKTARTAARAALEQADKGEDPATARAANVAERRVARANTFGVVMENFIAKHAMPNTRKGPQTKRTFEIHVVPEWGDCPIAEIRRKDAIALLDDIAARGMPSAAADVLKHCRKLFNWALERELVETNPFDRIRPPVELASRERTLNGKEIAVVWQASETLGYPFGTLVRLLLLTAQRRREISLLNWSWLDMDAEVPNFEVPKEFYKGKRAHVVPLSSKAQAIIAALPRFAGLFVLSTTGGRRPVSGFSKAKTKIDEEVLKLLREDDPKAEPLAPWTLHDLRRTVATHLGRLKTDPFTIDRVLGHAMPGLRGTYNRHEYLQEKAEALETWALELDRIVGMAGSNVVVLAR